jgi:hypothetical protein
MEGRSKQMTTEQIQILKQVCDAIVDIVRQSGPKGTPAGTMYAALMTQGCTMNQFEQIMGGLVRAGQLRKVGQLYFVAEGK